MKEYPLLCKAPVVRAILDGRQTQDRRPIRLREFRESDTHGYDFQFRDMRGLWNGVRLADMLNPPRQTFPGRCPYGVPGDVLWVRETWNITVEGYKYRADGVQRGWTWRPSIHMPRRAARLFLRLTDVRVQRVRDISEDDALAEGVDKRIVCGRESHRAAFALLWDECYGAGAWDRNDWVWALTFERMEG